MEHNLNRLNSMDDISHATDECLARLIVALCSWRNNLLESARVFPLNSKARRKGLERMRQVESYLCTAYREHAKRLNVSPLRYLADKKPHYFKRDGKNLQACAGQVRRVA